MAKLWKDVKVFHMIKSSAKSANQYWSIASWIVARTPDAFQIAIATMLNVWTIVIMIDLPFKPSCIDFGSLEVTWKYFMNKFYLRYWHFKLQKSNKEKNENNLRRLSKDWY